MVIFYCLFCIFSFSLAKKLKLNFVCICWSFSLSRYTQSIKIPFLIWLCTTHKKSLFVQRPFLYMLLRCAKVLIIHLNLESNKGLTKSKIRKCERKIILKMHMNLNETKAFVQCNIKIHEPKLPKIYAKLFSLDINSIFRIKKKNIISFM